VLSSERLKRYLVVSRDLSRKRNLARFRKAQKILNLPDDKLYEALQGAISDDPNILDDYTRHIDHLLDSAEKEQMGYLDFYRFLADLDHSMDDDVIDYLSYGEPNFTPYDNKTFEFEDQIDHVLLTGEFQRWRNRYSVVKGFTKLVKAKISPPAWMLEALAQGFSKHLQNPDPKFLAQQLGMEGTTSGKPNPYKDYRRLNEQHRAIIEMLILIGMTGITQIQAANAVKIKHDLKVSAKTLCNQFQKHSKENEGSIPPEGFSYSEISKTKFLTSFPVNAEKYLIKKRPVKR